MSIGLDVALNKTGLCAVGPETTIVGLLNNAPLTGATRLAHLRNGLINFMEIALSHVDLLQYACIESGAYEGGGRVFQLGQAHGIAQSVLADYGIPFSEVLPQGVKQFATGSREAAKWSVVKAAQAHIPLTIRQEDEADAFWLAEIARGVLHPSSYSERIQRTIIRKLKPVSNDQDRSQVEATCTGPQKT